MNAGGVRAFGAAIAALERELDWERLGRAYCEGDGSEFFDDELRARVLDTGLQSANDVADAVVAGGRAQSLYFGAALAELAPILAERLVLEREVAWLNLAGDETDELTRALASVGAELGIDLPKPSTAALASIAPASCDHLWVVSVFTDPDAFPALHDELYERRGGELATGRGELTVERRKAGVLASQLLERAAPRCVLTTTDEELAVIGPQADARGLDIDVPERARISAIVGDSVRMCRLRRR